MNLPVFRVNPDMWGLGILMGDAEYGSNRGQRNNFGEEKDMMGHKCLGTISSVYCPVEDPPSQLRPQDDSLGQRKVSPDNLQIKSNHSKGK